MFFTRFVSLIAAIVVFVTTYALVLPAITLEKTASCGLDEHQHSDACYEYVLTCGQEESEGHHHDDSCYTVTRELECDLDEHQHSRENGCYDEEGNLICQLEEHTHDDACYSEVKTLTCGREESEGHHHSDACYEKVLVCGKDVHTHSKDCYVDDGEADESNAEAADQASSVPMPEEAAGEQAAEAAAEETLPDNYVPELDPVNMEAVFGRKTGFYYFHAEEGQEVPSNSAEITDWQKVKDDTELAPTDLVKMYLPYTIPAGSLNETNPTARYRLPGNIHLTDDQIKAINKNENGITAGYSESDPEYRMYLGAEAIEGDRTPDELLRDGAEEFISAVVRAENVYENDKYIGQDLIFTFVPYTIEQNQTIYDAEKNPVSTGKKISGWFACDFRLDQIDWIEEEMLEEIQEETQEVIQEDAQENIQEETDQSTGDTTVITVEKTAEIIFATEDKEENIEEIKRTLKLVEKKEDTEDTVSDEDETEEETPEFQSGTLTADGDGYKIILDYTEEAEIPDNASLSVREITAETDKEAYEACLTQAQQHVDESGEAKSTVDSRASRFFDIEILVENEDGTRQKIEPAAPVSVNIQIMDAPADTADSESGSKEAMNSDPTVLHFTEDGVEQIESKSSAGETTAENSTSELDAASGKDANADSRKESNSESEGGETTAIRFEAESFSIYGVVYTVDFHWEVDGKIFEFSLPGGGFVSFTQLMEILGVAKSDEQRENDEQPTEVQNADASDSDPADNTDVQNNSAIILDDIQISEETRKFVADVEKVEFSSPELVWVGKIDENTTVGQVKDKYRLECEYSYRLTWDEIEKINATDIEAGDWGIISLKAFETNEQLKVTMKGGREFIIKVTDYAEYVPVENDGVTIPNPNGTTINMFDYWVDNSLKDRTGKSAWPGYNGNNYNITWHNDQQLMGNGNNSGINSWSGNANEGHALKFNPSDHYTVIDGNYNNWRQRNVNGDKRINCWQGDADPLQGLVQPTLNSEGYPTLTNNSSIGTNGEKLNYLFDGTSGDNMGKAVHPGVDGLLYVDRDGYYTYDSRDFTATYNGDTAKTFTLAPQTAAEGSGPRGFWPFGSEKFWFGMHLKVDFSMPSNGLVLNPSGVYKDMEFSFSGDDDTWIYVDGILVGDGGGVHNRTEIDVNFRTGTVYVTGKNDPSYTGTFESTTYLEDYYRNAGRFNPDDWVPVLDDQGEIVYRTVNGRQQPVLTFANGTSHDLQMFYMERGGGFSNLMIHYNLISTTDFSAHKSYHNTEGSVLRRNAYKFELIGYDNEEYADDNLQQAIMPEAVVWDTSKPLGTFENPLWQTVPASETTGGYRSLIIGNTEDGNINFGNKEISSAYAGKSYKYLVREIVPDNAENADGVRWGDASEELRQEGGFSLDGIMYDSKVYYVLGTVVETEPGSGKYKMVRQRFLDPEYSKPDPANFNSFVNGKETPVSLKVIKKSDDTQVLLDGAVFSLTRAMQNADEKWVVREWTINNATYHSQPVTQTTSEGTLTFSNLAEGHYILEELAAPTGYQMGDQHRWVLTLEKQDSQTKILLVPYITPLDAEGNPAGDRIPLDLPDENNIIEYEVLNGPLPPIDLSIKKQWNDNGDTSVPDGAEATFELHRIKTVPPVKVQLLDSQGEKVDEITAFVRDTIKIYDTATDSEKAFKHHTSTPSFWDSNKTRTRSDTITPNDNGWVIQTTTVYENSGWSVQESSSTSTSNGQYTVKQEDVTAGVVSLLLSDNYMASQTYGFDKLPKLYVSNSASGSTTADEVINTFTLKEQNGDGDSGNPWKKSFNDLPLVDENGHPYSYYFKEVNHLPANFNVQTVEGNMGSAASPLTESGNVVITNNAPELPRITASKVWLDENVNPIDAESGLDGLEVKLTLYKGTSVAPASEVRTGEVTRTVTGNGTATWLLLDENADVSQYTVKETAVKIPGGDFITIDPSTNTNAFDGQVTGDSSIGFTVTNQLPTTEIEVTKLWKDGTSANADKVFEEAQTISFTVYQKIGDGDGTVYQSGNQPVTGTVTYTPASGETAASWSTETISDLPKYKYTDGNWYEVTYYPVESELNGVTITYQSNGGNAVEDPAEAAVTTGTVTIINTDIVFPLKIVKADHDTGRGLSGAKFQLTRKLSGESSFTKFVHSSFEEDEENENQKTGPFTVDSTDGVVLEGLLPGEYRIAEKKAPDGYIITLQPFVFTINADGTISYPNASANELVSVLEKNGTNPGGLQIDNTPGAALPSTGGPGTRLFTILGSILIAGAGLLMWRRRRII